LTHPKPMRWRVRDPSDLIPALAFIGQAQPPYVITFKAGEESRRDQQNRFAFEAYAQIAAILGDRTPNDVRAETKLHCGIAIMRQDDDFRAKYDAMIRPLPYETKLAMMIEPFDFAVTRLMTVRQMTAYISQMLTYWDERGASVMVPDFDR
jgi:hypothetical protein